LNHKDDSVSSALSDLIDRESSALRHYYDSANSSSYHQYNNASNAPIITAVTDNDSVSSASHHHHRKPRKRPTLQVFFCHNNLDAVLQNFLRT
jgi:hypothetical protein